MNLTFRFCDNEIPVHSLHLFMWARILTHSLNCVIYVMDFSRSVSSRRDEATWRDDTNLLNYNTHFCIFKAQTLKANTSIRVVTMIPITDRELRKNNAVNWKLDNRSYCIDIKLKYNTTIFNPLPQSQW